MEKYLVRPFGAPKITKVICDKETKSSVWINGRQSRKLSESGSYFDTFEEAKNWLFERADKKVAHARRNLELANSYLGNVKSLIAEVQ